MSLLLLAAEMYLPEPLKRRKLEELISLTAAAFGRPAPSAAGKSYGDLLDEYARFSRDSARELIAGGQGLEATREKLYWNALRLGADLRRTFRVGGATDDVMRAARVVYRGLRIDFRGSPGGEVVIGRCYFSRYYSPAVCQVMSALDRGLLAGLSGGRQLQFSQRITDGADRCVARLCAQGAEP